jgi:hypothetical protein
MWIGHSGGMVMTNGQQAEIIAYCGVYMKSTLAYFGTLTDLAKWAFILAIGLAVLSALVETYARFRAIKVAAGGNPPANFGVAPSPDFLKAVIALIDSLAKAPVWFFLFVAGMALVWLSTIDLPRVCMPTPPPTASAPAPPTPAPPPKV